MRTHRASDSRGLVYFTAVTSTQGAELWRTNGTDAGTRIAIDSVPGREGDTRNVVDADGAL
jgi:ELWxxDGT repeat protein